MKDRKSKALILPKLAFTGIVKNGKLYLPYLLATTVSVAIFFIFCSISTNELLSTLPYSDYVTVLMIIGQVLLAIILAPFLSSTNRFLIKNRKKELGLYSILGLEKKHIGIIMLIETVITYAASILLGMAAALAFSKLVFLLLLNLTGLDVQTEFTVSEYSFAVTLIYFGVIAVYNLIVNLFQVSLTNPSELFKSSSKGEKPVKHVALRTILGIIYMAIGYGRALTSNIDSEIFTTFFLSVAFVVAGTELLFTSGSLAILKAFMSSKKLYYKKENFITTSGMFYRLKKSASSLSNIAIFSTMTIVTIVCTTSLFFGMDGALRHDCPMDASYIFLDDGEFDIDEFNAEAERLSALSGAVVSDRVDYKYAFMRSIWNGSEMIPGDGSESYINVRWLYLMTVEDYNRTQNKNVSLAKDEVLFFSTARDFGQNEITIFGHTFTITQELNEMNFASKHEKNIFDENYYIVFSDDEIIKPITEMAQRWGKRYGISFNFTGSEEARADFAVQMDDYVRELETLEYSNNIIERSRDTHPMFGGLLFLGIFFGIIFTVCMVLIMYYKQVSEGIEDRDGFVIMQKVGMTDKDVHETIRRQILTVFFLPIIAAVIHTIVATRIIAQMMSVLHVFNSSLIYICTASVIIIFSLFYGISYIFTSRAYYKAVAVK